MNSGKSGGALKRLCRQHVTTMETKCIFGFLSLKDKQLKYNFKSALQWVLTMCN